MKEDVKKEWVAALRGGDYQQTSGYLAMRIEGGPEWGYCCLGVLTDLACKAGVDGVRIADHNGHPQVEVADDGDDWEEYGDEDLPLAVIRWAGLEDADCPSNPMVEGHNLSVWNDDGPDDTDALDFEGIADLIERNL
jgi:hypothetical protein